ncbi:MAG: SDR family oxidoreductase [Thermoanaerobaculia bacterium]
MILVTGATGTVGQELVKELKAARAPFRVGARSPEKVSTAEAVRLDFDRPETFAPALDGVDKLFLLTSGGTEREGAAVEAAKKAGVKHLVKLSVWGAEENAFLFGRAHRQIEQKIEASGIPYTFLRPNSFMQNFTTHHAPTIRSQGAFYPYGHDSRISVIDARDIAAVAARALTGEGHAGKAYKLSGPESLTNGQMAEKLSRAIGKLVRFVDLPDPEYKKALMGAGVPEGYADALADLSRYFATGAGAPVTPDYERVVGRKPATFDQFARDHASVWR